jgi:hypothetical protein
VSIIKLLIVAIIVFIMITIFFPKPYIIGGLAGLMDSGAAAYKEEFKCLGFMQSYYPSKCADCGYVYNCYGIPYGKKCYIEKYNHTISKEITQCK